MIFTFWNWLWNKPSNTRLIVGLGNFPAKYHQTRHNFGWLVLDRLQLQDFSQWRFEEAFRGEISEGFINDHKIILLKPHTWMNNSGEAVKLVAKQHRIRPQNILAVSDDLDQFFGKIRWRDHGSSGGQKGLQSMIDCLQTNLFPRLKLGITSDARRDFKTEDFVLSPFTSQEQVQLSKIIQTAVEKIQRW